VVRLFAYCLEPPTVCLIMELLPSSLQSRLNTAGMMQGVRMPQLMQWATDVAAALAHLHDGSAEGGAPVSAAPSRTASSALVACAAPGVDVEAALGGGASEGHSAAGHDKEQQYEAPSRLHSGVTSVNDSEFGVWRGGLTHCGECIHAEWRRNDAITIVMDTDISIGSSFEKGGDTASNPMVTCHALLRIRRCQAFQHPDHLEGPCQAVRPGSRTVGQAPAAPCQTRPRSHYNGHLPGGCYVTLRDTDKPGRPGVRGRGQPGLLRTRAAGQACWGGGRGQRLRGGQRCANPQGRRVQVRVR
jgi:hypothetical protein